MAAEASRNDVVRSEVGQLLERSAGYQALQPVERDRLRADMEKVGDYLADGAWMRPPGARGLEDRPPPPPVEQLKKRMADKQGLVGSEFSAGGVREGVAAFGELVQKVDFPRFVSGLVQNVFQAVVDASIQQMKAFGELLAATAKSVDQFAADHVSDGQARDYIANRYPSAVRVDTSGQGPARLKPVEGSEVDVGADLGVPGTDLEDEEAEAKLVGAAKVELARQRQQTMAMMVLLGINRIVVTNGHINAKVVFDMRASDEARRRARAELHDSEHDFSAAAVSGFFGFAGGAAASGHDHETTVSSAVDESSESKAAVKAQLTGDVRLAFKSETFPLERMVDVIGMQNLSEKAQPVPARTVRAAPPAPAAVPAASPGGAR